MTTIQLTFLVIYLIGIPILFAFKAYMIGRTQNPRWCYSESYTSDPLLIVLWPIMISVILVTPMLWIVSAFWSFFVKLGEKNRI